MKLTAMLAISLMICSVRPPQAIAVASPHRVVAPKRPVTVSDMITMATLGSEFQRVGTNVVDFSPDGRKFALVIKKGNLRDDTVEYSLIVFKTADVAPSHCPEVVVTLASSSNNEALSHVKWLPDNDSLVFLGAQLGQAQQLYRVRSSTKHIEKLTNSSTPVVAYGFSNDGRGFAYLADVDMQPDISKAMRRRGFFVTSQPWDTLYAPRPPALDTRKELFYKASAMRVPRRIAILEPHPGVFLDGLALSPNGRYALIPAYTIHPPTMWAAYKLNFRALSFTTVCATGDAWQCPQQYLWVDLEKGDLKPLLDAPIVRGVGGSTAFAWTQQNTVLLINAVLPLDSLDVAERTRRVSQLYALEISIPDLRVTKITMQEGLFPASRIKSYSVEGRFIAEPYTPAAGQAIEFRKDIAGWKSITLGSEDDEANNGLTVKLEQGINSPPKLVAHDPKTHKTTVLYDLNPQFAQLNFGRVTILRWKSRDGRDAQGTLYFPPDYVAGTKYPLVIQTHGNTRDEFWIDGPFTTAFAAQPLASKGFLVLQMGIGDRYDKLSLQELSSILDTPAEAEYALGFLEGAIDELNRQGLIDQNRIGLTGFSRTVYHTLFALTHSTYKIAAAVAADGVNFGYVGCLFYFTNRSGSLCEKMNGGGPPFGASLAGWAKAAPTFNLDKVHAPLLLQAIGAPIGEWEILAGLRWLNKPVEMINFYPEGVHELVQPQQRLLSQGSVVDWYCFWLKGEEDPDPSKAEQYSRWRKMREQRPEPPSSGY